MPADADIGDCGGQDENRTRIRGFAVRCVTIPPPGQTASNGQRGLVAPRKPRFNQIFVSKRSLPALRDGDDAEGRAIPLTNLSGPASFSAGFQASSPLADHTTSRGKKTRVKICQQ